MTSKNISLILNIMPVVLCETMNAQRAALRWLRSAIVLALALSMLLGLVPLRTFVARADVQLMPNDPLGASTVGDFVWRDTNLDGQPDFDEVGIDGVLLELYQDDGDGSFEPSSEDALIATMTTGDDPNSPALEQGWYDFDVDLGPAHLYWVNISPSNFVTGGALAGYSHTSSETIYANPALVIEQQTVADRNDFAFGFARSGLQHQTSVYLGHNQGAGCPGADTLSGVAHTLFTYCFAITNIGETYLTDLTLSAPELGITLNDLTRLSGTLPLAPNASLVYYYETTLIEDLSASVTVTATPQDAQGGDLPIAAPLTATDDIAVDLQHVAVQLAKSVYVGHDQGSSCAGVKTLAVANSTDITWCFAVTNTGDTWLDSVQITDTLLGIGQDDLVLRSGDLPLAANASLLYFYETTVNGDMDNTAAVSATPVDAQGKVLPGFTPPSDTDSARIEASGPGIRLTKTVSTGHDDGASCSGERVVTAPFEAAVTWCFLVTNVGDTYLNGVEISDASLQIDQAYMLLRTELQLLAPGDALLYYYETIVTGDLRNAATATATATDEQGNILPDAVQPFHTNHAQVLRERGSISGTVWEDRNGNSSADPDEASLAGVQVTLGTSLTTTTGSDGSYRFDNLLDGVHRVRVLPSSDYEGSGDIDGGMDNQISNIEIINGSHIVGQDFLVRLVPGRIGGHVYDDRNANGSLDTGEPALADVFIQLSDGSVTTTDASGAYLFANLPPATYTVTAANLAGYVSTGDADRVNDDTIMVTLSPGEFLEDQNFYDVELAAIQGQVFEDRNGNGVFDTDEPLLSGIVVLLNDVASTITRTATTDRQGTYRIDGLWPGTYHATIANLTGFSTTTLMPLSVVLQENRQLLEANFGLRRTMSVGNRVWLDNGAGGGIANNGLLDGAESGLDNVKISLLWPDGTPVLDDRNTPRITATNQGGYYLFTDLTPGNYIVHVLAENFRSQGRLVGLVNSLPTEIDPNRDGDNNDNGLNRGQASNDGIESGMVQLIYDAEVLNEPNVDPILNQPIVDSSSNLSIDFGFIPSEAIVSQSLDLYRFTARLVETHILIQWETRREGRTRGFHLYRSQGDDVVQAVQLTPSLYVSQGLDGGVYEHEITDVASGDPLLTTAELWLVEVELSGQESWYGPIRVRSGDDWVYLPLVVR